MHVHCSTIDVCLEADKKGFYAITCDFRIKPINLWGIPGQPGWLAGLPVGYYTFNEKNELMGMRGMTLSVYCTHRVVTDLQSKRLVTAPCSRWVAYIKGGFWSLLMASDIEPCTYKEYTIHNYVWSLLFKQHTMVVNPTPQEEIQEEIQKLTFHSTPFHD